MIARRAFLGALTGLLGLWPGRRAARPNVRLVAERDDALYPYRVYRCDVAPILGARLPGLPSPGDPWSEARSDYICTSWIASEIGDEHYRIWVIDCLYAQRG